MTSIHAPVPPNYATAVREAKYRGEDPDSISEAEQKEQKETTAHPRPRKQPRLNIGTTMKPTRRAPTALPTNQQPTAPASVPGPAPPQDENISDSENEDPASASKENNPSLSPTPIRQNLTPPSPRKALGKRPLSVLSIPYPDDQDTEMMIIDTDDDQDQHNYHSSSSEQNINANNTHTHHPNTRSRSRSPRKSPKRIFLGKQALSPTTTPQTIPPFRLRDDLQIYEDVPDRTLSDFSSRFGTAGPGMSRGVQEVPSPHCDTGGTAHLSNPISTLAAPIQSKVVKKVPSGPRKCVQKAKPRIGVRRL
jgi:ubiquitin-conjugating enzyme E2 S